MLVKLNASADDMVLDDSEQEWTMKEKTADILHHQVVSGLSH